MLHYQNTPTKRKKKSSFYFEKRDHFQFSAYALHTAYYTNQPNQPPQTESIARTPLRTTDFLRVATAVIKEKGKKKQKKNEYRASKEYNHRGRAVVGDSRVDWRPQVDGHINDFLREARGNAKPVFLCISLSSAISPSLISSLSLARTSLSLPTVLPRVQSYIYSAGEASPHPTTIRLRGSTIVSVRETTRDRARLRAGRGGGEEETTKHKEKGRKENESQP